MYKWVAGIAKNRAWTRIETLWGEVQRIAEVGENHDLIPKLQSFADEFEQLYIDHVEPDSGVPLDKVYGDLSHVLLGILDLLDKRSATDSEGKKSGVGMLVPMADVFERMLALAEKIVRDEKYRQIVKSTPEALHKVLALLEKASTTEGKVTVLKVVVHLGQTNEDKLAISKLNGIQKILQLLSTDQKLVDQINRTLQHFLQDSSAPRSSLSREGSTSSPVLSSVNTQQLSPALGSLVKVGLTIFARASQQLVKIVGSRRNTLDDTKESVSALVQQAYKYVPLQPLRVAHIVESVELLQLAPSQRSAEAGHAAAGGGAAQFGSADRLHLDDEDESPFDQDSELVKEFMLVQGIVQKLTLHIKEAARDNQVELMSTLGQVLQGSAVAQSQFKSLDGYSAIGTILSSISQPDSPSSSVMLDHAFPIIEATARDVCGEYVGNTDAFLLLAKLASASHHLAIRWRAANSIMTLINENPENAAVFLGIRGFQMMIECLPLLPSIAESYADPMHTHFRNFLFYIVQILLAGATLLQDYSLSIVECMAASLIRHTATPSSELPTSSVSFCQPIVQSVLVQCIFTSLSHYCNSSSNLAISSELVQRVVALIDVSSPSCIIDVSADVSVADVLDDPWNKTAAEHGIIDSIYMTEVARLLLMGLHSDLTNSDAIGRILTIPRLLSSISSHCVSSLVSSHALSAVHSTLLRLLERLQDHVDQGVSLDAWTNPVASHLRICIRELACTVVISYSQRDTSTVKRILALKALAYWCHTAYTSYHHVSEVYRASLMSIDALHAIFGTWRLAGPELARACLTALFAFMHCSKFVRSRVQVAMSPLQFAANVCNNSNLKWDPSASFMLFSILGVCPNSGGPLSPLAAIQSLSALPVCGLVREDSVHVLWTGLRWPIIVEQTPQGIPVAPLSRSPSVEFSARGPEDSASDAFKFDPLASFQNLSYVNFQFHSEYEASVAIHVVDQCAPSSQGHLSTLLAETFSQSPRNCLLASSVKGLEIFVDRFALLSETDESRNGIMALITKLGQYSIRSQALSTLLKCALDDASLDKNLQALFVIGEICGRDSPSSYFELLKKSGSRLLISYPDRLPNDKVGFTIACWLRVWEWGGDTSTLFEFKDHTGNCFAEVTLMKPLDHNTDPSRRLVCIEVRADAKERAKSPLRAKSPIPLNSASATQGQDHTAHAAPEASSGLFQFTAYEYKADGCWQLLTISFSKNGVVLSINGKSLQTLGNVAYPSNVRSMQVILGSDSKDDAMHATVSSVSVYEGVLDNALCLGCFDSGPISSVAPRVTSAKKPLLVLTPQLFADRSQKDSSVTAAAASIVDPLASQLLSFLVDTSKQESDISQPPLPLDAANSLVVQRRPSGGEVGFTDRLLAGLRSFRDDTSEVEPKEKEAMLSSPLQKGKASLKDATAIGSGVVVHLTSFVWEAINQKTGALRLLKAVANMQSQVAALQVLTRLLNGPALLRDSFAAANGYHALTAALQTPKTLNNDILECLTSIASCSPCTDRRPLKDAHCAVLLADLLLHVDARTQQAILAQISDSITGLADSRVIWRESPDLKYSKFTLWLDELAPECRRQITMIIGSNFDSFQAPDVQFVCQWLITKPGNSMDIRADLLEHLVELWYNGTASLSLLRPTNPKMQHEAFDFALALMLNPHDGIQSAAVRLLSMILCSSKSASEYFHKTYGWLAVVAAVGESKEYITNVRGPGPELCKALLCAAMGNLSTSSSSHSSSASAASQKLVDPNAIQALIMFLSERDVQSHIVSTMLHKLISIIVASGADPTKEKPEYQSASNMSIALADAGMLHWLKILWRRWGDSDPDLSSIMLLSRSASQSDLAAIFEQGRLRSESESSRTSFGTSDDSDGSSDTDERSEADSVSTDGTGAPMADSVRLLIRSLARIICLADLLRSKPRLPTLLAPEIDDDTDVWGRLVRAEVVHAFDRMPRLFEANTTSALKAFVALMQPMLLHQGPKDIFILMGLTQTIKNLTLRSTPAVRGSFADSGFSKLSDDSCRVSCRAAIADPELASILLASNSLGEFALMPVFSKFECTDVLALLLVLHRSMADREPRGALVRRSAISLRDRLGSDAAWRTSLRKAFDEDSSNRDVGGVVAFFSKETDDDAAHAWLKGYMTNSEAESREAVDAMLQRKWQQLQLPSAGTSVKAKEGESQWSSFFYSLFDKGGSEEAGSMKARADKAKKLADYDRRLQESKENVAFWMNQIKTIVDASRKVLDDGAAALRDGAKARVLQGHKALQKLGEEHTHLRHSSDSGASDREGGGVQEQLPPAAGAI